MIQVRYGAATDLGLVRSTNEDSFLAAPPVFLVADGMGGYAAGAAASAIVVAEFRVGTAVPVSSNWVVAALERANTKVVATSGGGTTVAGVAAILQNGADYWMVFNIGDSRVYRLSEGEFSQISVDHSVVQELVDEGSLDEAGARIHPQRHVITRAVGAPEKFEPDYWLLPARAGDRLMMCSDGITSEMDPEQIDLLTRSQESPQQVADSLVACAVRQGGRDNVTVVVVDVLAVNDARIDLACSRGYDAMGITEVDDRTLRRRLDLSESSVRP